VRGDIISRSLWKTFKQQKRNSNSKMNTDQVGFAGSPTANTVPMATTNALPHTTAHSYTIHSREERHLEKERTKESKRAVKMAAKAGV
jgi:hypothetical protein